MTEYQALALVVSALSLVVAGLALHFARQAQARAARAEGREIAAEVRAEEAHKLAVKAAERAEEAHNLLKSAAEGSAAKAVAEREAPEIVHGWLRELRQAAPGSGAIVTISVTLHSAGDRLAADLLEQRKPQYGVLSVKREGGEIQITADLLKLKP